MVGSGSAGRYLLYALGEIVLVVIGILIALQINNWNEYRKDRKTEKVILLELQENISRNQSILEFHKSLAEQGTQSCNSLMNLINQKSPYNKTIDSKLAAAFGFRIPTLANSAYESLKSTGLNIISSDHLKKEIIELYDMYFDHLEISLRSHNETTLQPQKSKFTLSNFEVYWGKDNKLNMKPNNYPNLIEDQQYKNLLQFLKSSHELFVVLYDESLGKTDKVLQLIKDELVDT